MSKQRLFFGQNVSFSSAKRKLAEKTEWKFSNQSGEVIYDSIYLKITEEDSFFRLSYLEYNFMIANLVTLNLAILKILEM